MTITKTIGNTGADYATPNLWYTSLPSSLADDYVGNVLIGEIVCTVDNAVQGITNNGHTILLTAAPGNGFADHANKLTNPLRYNPTVGAAIRRTAAQGGPIPGEGPWALLDIGVDGIQVTRLQFTCEGLGIHVVELQSSAALGVLDGCIIWGNPDNHGYFTNAVQCNYGHPMTNCLCYSYYSKFQGWLPRSAVGIKGYNNTIISLAAVPDTSGINSVGIWNDYVNSPDVRNTVVCNFNANYPAGTAMAGTTNNATDKGSFEGTGYNVNGQTSVVMATEFENATIGTEDFRVKSTAVKLPLNGSPTGTPTLDILGQTRSLTAPTIGAFEVVSAPPATLSPGRRRFL